MEDRFDPAADWNQNILRNLRFKFPTLTAVPDRDLLTRYSEWGMMGLDDDGPGMVEYLVTGE